MKKLIKLLKKLLQSRLLVFGLILAVELFWFLIFVTRLVNYSTAISIAFTGLSLLVVLWIINRDDNPAYKMAWIILIMAVPLLGGLFYLAVGHKQPSRKMRRKMEAERLRTENELLQDPEILKEAGASDRRIEGQMRYISETGGYPVYRNTSARYYQIGEELYQDLLEELKKAEHFIFMEFFIVGEGKMWGSIRQILEEKAKAGVDVRFMYDDLGSVSLLPGGYDRHLEAVGIKSIAFNPFVPFWSLVMNNRDHRKIAVIDGHTAFSGGVNLADEYINRRERHGHWKDTAVMLKGEAVKSFTLMFLQLWNVDEKEPEFDRYLEFPCRPRQEAGGYVLPYGDCPLDNDKAGERVYMDILNRAKDYVYIMSPYLILDGEMETALKFAAERGVDVRLVLPGIPDKKIPWALAKTHYSSLMASGVKICEYTPGFVHAKVFVSDDREAVVGTINLDYRSLYHHFECAAYMYGTDCIADIKADVEATIARSAPVPVDFMNREKLSLKLLGFIMKALAPLI